MFIGTPCNQQKVSCLLGPPVTNRNTVSREKNAVQCMCSKGLVNDTFSYSQQTVGAVYSKHNVYNIFSL